MERRTRQGGGRDTLRRAGRPGRWAWRAVAASALVHVAALGLVGKLRWRSAPSISDGAHDGPGGRAQAAAGAGLAVVGAAASGGDAPLTWVELRPYPRGADQPTAPSAVHEPSAVLDPSVAVGTARAARTRPMPLERSRLAVAFAPSSSPTGGLPAGLEGDLSAGGWTSERKMAAGDGANGAKEPPNERTDVPPSAQAAALGQAQRTGAEATGGGDGTNRSATAPSGPPGAAAGGAGANQASPAAPGGGGRANQGVGPAPLSSGPDGVRGGTSHRGLESYRAALLQALRRQRGYPLFARRLLQQGRLLLRLVLRSDGALASPPALVAPSSYPLLNAEALRMATAAAPFAPPPIGPGATLVVVVPVEFELRNTAPTIADASTP